MTLSKNRKNEEIKLENIPFIDAMTEKAKEKLIEQAVQKKLRSGQALFKEGQKADALFVILSGKIKLVTYDAEGREQIVGIFSTGETIWEGIFQKNSVFPFGAVCLTSCKISIISGEDFMEALRDGDSAIGIISMLSKKLHDANKRNIILATKDPKVRIARFLLYRHKREYEGSIHLRLEDVAASLGIRPETASRKLKELIEEKIIVREGYGKIKILNFEKLEELIK